MKNILLIASMLFVAGAASAQVVLDNFGVTTATGDVLAGSSWVGNVQRDAQTITVSGNDDNGWGVFNLSAIDASAMAFVLVTAKVDLVTAASSFQIQFEDANSVTTAFSVSLSAFTSELTTVAISTLGWTGGIDPSQIVGWTIGGGNIATTGPAFRMTNQ